jgi:hypothetical protein
MGEVQYKGRHIETQSYKSDDGRWRPKATVITFEGGSARPHPVSAPIDVVFDTEQEADGYAVEMAQKWIDVRG